MHVNLWICYNGEVTSSKAPIHRARGAPIDGAPGSPGEDVLPADDLQ